MRVRVLSSVQRALFVLCTIALMLASRPANADDYVFIRNAKNPLPTISATMAREVFTGRVKQWPGGAVVQTVIGEEGAGELAWLASRIFGTSVRELLTKIKQEVFRGEMKRPVVVHSSADAVSAVAQKEGAIAVVDGATARNLPSTVVVVPLTD